MGTGHPECPERLDPIEDWLLHSRDERGVHTLTLDRAASFNALSEDMLNALQQEGVQAFIEKRKPQWPTPAG